MPSFIHTLRELGLIASEWQTNSFLPGDEFIHLLSFLGCAPTIHLHPDDGDQFCHIRIGPITASAKNLGHTATVIPRCPACKHKIREWKNIDDWRQGDTVYTCHECASKQTMGGLRWRQEGGYGRFSLDIAHVHPHEAVPSEKLLSALEQATGFEWIYFYATN